MRGKDDKIAFNVGGEQTAKREKADDVDASTDYAENGREQFRIERAPRQRSPEPGCPAFNALRHVPNRALWSDALAKDQCLAHCTIIAPVLRYACETELNRPIYTQHRLRSRLWCRQDAAAAAARRLRGSSLRPP